MFSLISKMARDAAYASGSADVGEAKSNLNVRRIAGGINDNTIRPEHGMEQQLDSFRGTVYAAVDKIARRRMQIPIRLFQHEFNKDRIDETQLHFHPFLTLFANTNGRKPHPEFSVAEFVYSHSASLDMTGESWWLTERDEVGRPARVTPLPANRMTIVFSKETGLTAGYFFTPKGTTMHDGGIFIPARPWEYLHKNPTHPFVTFFRYPSPRGVEDIRGWSPIKAAAYAYDINLYEQIYKRNFLLQGAQLGGILQSDVALSKEQIEEYVDQFKNRHSGLKHAGLPMVLPKMLKWETTEPTPRDMQWAEAIGMTQSQILQIYGISDAKLGRADIGNRNTADAMDVTFNREVIKSRLDMDTDKINSDFLPIYPGQSAELYFCARYDDPVPADSAQQLERDKQDIELNVRTRNEIRQERRLPPMGKFGDQTWMPITHVAVDPFEAKLELSQDDADKLGYISPEEQAKLDKETAEAAAAAKAKNEPKDTAKTTTTKK